MAKRSALSLAYSRNTQGFPEACVQFRAAPAMVIGSLTQNQIFVRPPDVDINVVRPLPGPRNFSETTLNRTSRISQLKKTPRLSRALFKSLWLRDSIGLNEAECGPDLARVANHRVQALQARMLVRLPWYSHLGLGILLKLPVPHRQPLEELPHLPLTRLSI